MENNLIYSLVRLIGMEAIRRADNFMPIGTDRSHIESIRMLPNKEGEPWRFEMTTWSDFDEEPRKTKEVSLVELLSSLGSAVAGAARYEISQQIIDEKL